LIPYDFNPAVRQPQYNRADAHRMSFAMNDFTRITQNPAVMGGKPCIRGLRVTVGMIVGQIGAGRSIDQLLADYPYLRREDVLEALRYAAWRAQEREIDLAAAE
jgi:uncharacterized protein (DUF433 family)